MRSKFGGYLAISVGFGMVTAIATQNISSGIGFGMAGGMTLALVLKRIFK